MLRLEIKKREAGKDLDALRAQGFIPAVMYGPTEASTPIAIKKTDFIKVFREAGESSVIELSGDGMDHEALIHDAQFDAVTVEPAHVDFYLIEKGKKVQVNIPLEFVGTSAAVKTLGGTLMKVMHEIEIEAMPKDLPHNVEVSIDSLVDFEAKILASDIKLPSSVTLITNPEEVIALVQEAREEKEEEAVAFDASKIEVEEKGKKEEETEAAE